MSQGYGRAGWVLGRAAIAIAGLLLLGCKVGADNTINATLAEQFRLKVGESALIESENMRIGFQAVSADSRCGKGDTCIWEGDATVRIWLQSDGGERQERELHTAAREANAVDHAGYSVRLVALNPPAISGTRIAPADYVATLQFVRGHAEDAIY